jgi:predicted transcriptional regulator of viral defense system
MNFPASLGKTDHQRITTILHSMQYPISVTETANTLQLSKQAAAKLLSRLETKGWLSRIKRGLYAPIYLESIAADVSLEKSWLIAKKLYHQCYIGGQSAAHYWGFTEQSIGKVVVLTTLKPRDRHPIIQGIQFFLRTVPQDIMFGLQTVGQEPNSVLVSDPARTVVDFLVDPALGGGIREVTGIIKKYLKSEHRNLDLLFDYARRLYNGAVLKRLGFLLERLAPGEMNIIASCKIRINTGNVKLDPQLGADKLITGWNLWIPLEWESILLRNGV